jgi:acetyl-CoA acetyltransferase
MRPKSIAVVGAAETTRLGVIPDMSQIQLHADAALNAMADAGLKPADIDGVATAGETPVTVAHYLGITPKWVDGTAVGGCSFMLHTRHAAAAIAAGLCETVLITHGESGRSGIGRTRNIVAPSSLAGQFEQPYGPLGPPTLFTLPVLRYMKTYGLKDETLAMVSVVQREWAAQNPRATFKEPITVEDVLNSRMIAYPFRLLQCCLVTDGGGALILVAAERARDFPQKPVYILGSGESVETPMVSQMADFTSSRAFRVSGAKAFAEAGITHHDVDHLMIYDAFAHLPIYGLEDLGFVPPGEGGPFIAARHTAPGVPGRPAGPRDYARGLKAHGRPGIPLNTNGGGLSYMHSGMYGMYALQESVRQLRGTAPAQVPGAQISVCHGVGGMFAAAGTIIFSNAPP